MFHAPERMDMVIEQLYRTLIFDTHGFQHSLLAWYLPNIVDGFEFKGFFCP